MQQWPRNADVQHLAVGAEQVSRDSCSVQLDPSTIPQPDNRSGIGAIGSPIEPHQQTHRPRGKGGACRVLPGPARPNQEEARGEPGNLAAAADAGSQRYGAEVERWASHRQRFERRDRDCGHGLAQTGLGGLTGLGGKEDVLPALLLQPSHEEGAAYQCPDEGECKQGDG